MKIPALRSQIGCWTYYVTTLTFEQVSTFVSRIDDQLHKSESLKDSIQRSITNNYISIRDYILNQPELFFNSLVLAVYDDYPSWREIEFTYDGNESYQMGLLEFPSNHKVFPVDGQHRVEGIKAALLENAELNDERIATIFIGHKNDREGMQRTRRLFTTLNRYAKPVSLNDIIALDEDDTVAITTRFLLEEYDLFTDKRVVLTKQKAISPNNKDAITSIITLYQANLEIFKLYFEQQFERKLTKRRLEEYLKLRPSQEELDSFQNYCLDYWNAFKENLDFVSAYLNEEINPAESFRSVENGGNLIFRPIGFLPLVKASLIINSRTNAEFAEIFARFNEIDFNLSAKPWLFVAWNPLEKKMITDQNSLIQLLLLYLYDSTILNEKELTDLTHGYALKIAYEGPKIEKVLEDIR